MTNPTLHRKLVRHYDEPGHAHELTWSCYQRQPLLIEGRRCALLSQCIDRAVPGRGFELIAFVYMPEHVHLIVWPVEPAATVAKLLFAIKRPFSFRVKSMIAEANSELARQLTIRERPGKETFRFWQEGPGFDRNITNTKTLRTAVEYVHNNPVRRGLCSSPGDWKWSSWGFYFAPDYSPDTDLPTVAGFTE
ncbi:MAG: transposase [Phycisphaerales bacterium]|nr:MAG: transposase [Phycisphaerales bacterium]